jgi:hypothetical protein
VANRVFFPSMQPFKYAGTYGTKILHSCEVKVSDPLEFNDPFEFCPQVVTAITAEQVLEKFKDVGFLQNIFQRNSEIRLKCASVDDFLNAVEKDTEWWVDFFLQKFTDPKRFMPHTFAEIAARHLGVICFSQVYDDILMWAHYGEYHRGMVIQFDAKCFGEANLDPVEYMSDRPPYNPVFDVEGFEHLARVTRRKSDHWSYEKELRLLVPWELTRERTSETGDKMRMFAVPPTAIVRVILGCMAQARFAEETKRILSEKRFGHVHLQAMARDLHQYRLHVVDL